MNTLLLGLIPWMWICSYSVLENEMNVKRRWHNCEIFILNKMIEIAKGNIWWQWWWNIDGMQRWCIYFIYFLLYFFAAYFLSIFAAYCKSFWSCRGRNVHYLIHQQTKFIKYIYNFYPKLFTTTFTKSRYAPTKGNHKRKKRENKLSFWCPVHTKIYITTINMWLWIFIQM